MCVQWSGFFRKGNGKNEEQVSNMLFEDKPSGSVT